MKFKQRTIQSRGGGLMCVLLIIYPLRTNHTSTATPYDISVFSISQLRRNNAAPLPLINPPNYSYQSQRTGLGP